MADEVNSQQAHLHNNPVYPHEKITPAASIENSTSKESEEKDMKYGERVQEKEIGLEPTHSSVEGDSEEVVSRERRLFEKYKIYIHLLIWLVMTGWWIAGLVLHRKDLGWLIPFLVWLGLTIRLVTLHVSTK